MDKISFEGIGALTATFACGEGVRAGQVVKMTDAGTVGPCTAGDRFCGVAVFVNGGYAAVQVAGFATVAASDETLSEGFTALAADGKGGVKSVETGGGEYLTAAAGNGCATILL